MVNISTLLLINQEKVSKSNMHEIRPTKISIKEKKTIMPVFILFENYVTLKC